MEMSRITPFPLVTELVQGNASFNGLAVSLMRWGVNDYNPSLDSMPYNYELGPNQNNAFFILNE